MASAAEAKAREASAASEAALRASLEERRKAEEVLNAQHVAMMAATIDALLQTSSARDGADGAAITTSAPNTVLS